MLFSISNFRFSFHNLGMCRTAFLTLWTWCTVGTEGGKTAAAHVKPVLGKNPTTVLFGTSRCLCSSVTLGKATVLQPRPSSSSTSLTVTALHRTLNSVIRWKRLQIGGSPVMHIKTTKCNRFCLVASVTSRELFHHSEVQVTVRCH